MVPCASFLTAQTDLSNSTDNPSTTTVTSSQDHSRDGSPAPKKRREDESSPATQS